jgi:hypothetical protein
MSRLTLYWFNLTKREGKDTLLTIPLCTVFSDVIDRAFPELDYIPWRSVEEGRCYTYIKNLSEPDFDRLNNFLDTLHHLVFLTPSDHLKPHFTDELTEAYALDFNFQQGVQPLTRTAIGNLEHLAKDHQDSQAIAEVARRLAEVIRRHPTLSRADVIAAMPRRPSSAFHLPIQLLAGIGAALGRSVGLNLTKAEHPKLRTLHIDQKLSALAGVFALGEPVQGKSVLVIDDLYQSGVTAWSLAKFLKSQGAREVYALACVKSWSDTDNV